MTIKKVSPLIVLLVLTLFPLVVQSDYYRHLMILVLLKHQ